jgi:preprotein translocase subunit SecG
MKIILIVIFYITIFTLTYAQYSQQQKEIIDNVIEKYS